MASVPSALYPLFLLALVLVWPRAEAALGDAAGAAVTDAVVEVGVSGDDEQTLGDSPISPPVAPEEINGDQNNEEGEQSEEGVSEDAEVEELLEEDPKMEWPKDERPKTTKSLYATLRSRRTVSDRTPAYGGGLVTAVAVGFVIALIGAFAFRGKLFAGDDEEQEDGYLEVGQLH